jgi:LPS-assembly protein
VRLKYLKTLLLLIMLSPIAWGSVNTICQRQAFIAKQLGWITQKNACNLCNGYFRELPIIYLPNPRVKSQTDNYNIHADHVIIPLKHGPYVFKHNVTITQIDRQLIADKAYAYRDKNTGKVALIKTTGNVRLRAPSKLIIAKSASYNVKTKKILLHDAHYRLARGNTSVLTVKNPKTGKTEKHVYQLSAHGSAKQVQHTDDKITVLKNATYSTCQPNRCEVWVIEGSTIKLNSNTGRGESWNTRLYVQGLPILYLPYFNFPINHKRHTGFLFPKIGISSSRGFSIATPFYWNIAPNYDATITPNYMQKRGVLLQGVFRYLIPHSNGRVGFGYLPNDRKFKRFKRNNPGATGSDDRKKFFFKNLTKFNQNLSAMVDYNKVSDDYYLHDLGSSLINNSENQLLRQARIKYTNDIWSFLGNLQSYQTLHPVDQADISNQYARLPQLQIGANFPANPNALHFGFNGEWTRFTFKQNPYPDTTHILGVSTRTSLRPYVSLPLNWLFAYITPRAQLQFTSYQLQKPQFGFTKSPSVAIPILDVKGGMYFDRIAHLFRHDYQQTLEPTVYYLYVPYHNQNDIPYFDTSTQTFDYNFMFLDNRFSGIDRIGDANQVTLGVTTRFLDQDTGDEKASASIGRIYYFKKRRVRLCYSNNCPESVDDQYHASPITAMATYNFDPRWSIDGKATWSNVNKSLNNRDIGLRYRPDADHIFNVDYNYIRQGDETPGLPVNDPGNDLKQTNVAGYWKISQHWGIMGRWNYNWSHKSSQAFLYGFSYDSCCWAIKFVVARTFSSLGPAPDYQRRYDNGFYVEVALKGLGTFANTGTGDFLAQSISGYHDVFERESRL